MEKSIIQFKCPHCQQTLAFVQPEKGDSVTLVCPACNNTLRIKIQKKDIRMPEPSRPSLQKMARLVIINGPQTVRQSFALRYGSNVIGRQDDDTVQDIAISEDPAISRRSVDLTVNVNADGEYTYVLHVVNATNAVYVNNTLLHVGSSVDLIPGDTIRLGATKLLLAN